MRQCDPTGKIHLMQFTERRFQALCGVVMVGVVVMILKWR